MQTPLVILEKPFVSEEMLDYLEESQAAVLSNAVAKAVPDRKLNLTGEEEFVRLYRQGGRLYTASENALNWVSRHIPDADLNRSVDFMKNKTRFRELTKTLCPGLFFMETDLRGLMALDFHELNLPLVIKPSVGFFSLGVYTVHTKEDWLSALSDIRLHAVDWEKEYPSSVIGSSFFLLEQYIGGQEYAVDAYYDGEGRAVILDIMRHDFSSASDVSDRLYYTGKEIIREFLDPFTVFLNRVNNFLKAKNIPFHAELRFDGTQIIPIEFNPLRFAGWCCTDLSWFSYGFKTYEAYLSGRNPDWPSLLRDMDDSLYAMIVLNKPSGAEAVRSFDYDGLLSHFKNPLCLRRVDFNRFSTFGFLFAKISSDCSREMEYILQCDLMEFVD